LLPERQANLLLKAAREKPPHSIHDASSVAIGSLQQDKPLALMEAAALRKEAFLRTL